MLLGVCLGGKEGSIGAAWRQGLVGKVAVVAAVFRGAVAGTPGVVGTGLGCRVEEKRIYLLTQVDLKVCFCCSCDTPVWLGTSFGNHCFKVFWNQSLGS